jgi:ribosomal protein S12 methylthiotransferase accessory factor
MSGLSLQTDKAWRRGAHRAVSPAETFARVRPHFGAMGITRVANVTGLDVIGLPVTMALRPNARSLAVSPGKGLDLDAAMASAAMESLECWHAERPLLPLLHASRRELAARHRTLDVGGLPAVAVRPFDPDRPILWVEATDLVTGEAAWAPYELVHLNFTLPLPPSSGALMPGSNGLASGNTPQEALAHALHELIERDAQALWHAGDEGARARTRLDLGTVDDEACCEVLARFADARVEVAAWELTSDVGLPAFRCEIVDRDVGPAMPFRPGFGAGCHTDRAVALARALTEAAQTRLTLVTGARDDLRADHYRDARDAATLARMRAAMRAPGPTRSFRDAPNLVGETLDDDLLTTLGALVRAGLREIAVVDLARPDVGVPVVRALVPGLEGVHEAPGYLPGARMRRALAASGRGPS